MIYKKSLIGTSARDKILAGAKKVYEPVASSLGPRGSNCSIGRDFGSVITHHDGINILRELTPLEDPFENIGAELVKDAADKMDAVGDGTTLTTILTYAIAKEANKNIVAGANSRMIRKGIELAVDKIVDNVDKMAIPITTDEQIKQIATISAQDEEIGDLISTAIKKLGKDAIITVEESGSADMSIDYKEGMAFDKGYQHREFINKPESNECVIEDPYILITDKVINDLNELSHFLLAYDAGQKARTIENASIVIISNGVHDAPLATLISGKRSGIAHPLCITAPGYGEQQIEFLNDLAVSTGATLISSTIGTKLVDFDIKYLGRAKKVVSTKDSTTIIGGMGEKKNIDERVGLIKSQIKQSKAEYDTEKLQERLAKLTSGIAVINVGASSDSEMREKKEACIDAISAVKSSLEDGIVAGGETTLISCINSVPHGLDGDIAIGAGVVVKACTKPFEKLMENSGYNAGQMLERLISQPEGYGIDVMDGKSKNMIEAGIIDPAKVVKSALRNAASCAGSIITTDSIVATFEDKNGNGQE